LADLNDGLHFGPTGNLKVLEALKAVIREEYPELVPEDINEAPNMPLHFPHWSAFNGKDEDGCRELIEGWKWQL
jgi:hypothetical protein